MNNYRDKREYKRVEFYQLVSCSQYYSPKGQLIKPEKNLNLTIMNISIDGICIVTDRLLEDNTILMATLYIENYPHPIMCRVAWSKRIGEAYKHGLEFINISSLLSKTIKEIVTRGKNTNLEYLAEAK